MSHAPTMTGRVRSNHSAIFIAFFAVANCQPSLSLFSSFPSIKLNTVLFLFFREKRHKRESTEERNLQNPFHFLCQHFVVTPPPPPPTPLRPCKRKKRIFLFFISSDPSMASSSYLVTILLLFIVNVALSQKSQNFETNPTSSKGCDKRWIHIRKLPARFNLDLLANCSEYPLFDDFCPYLANHGLGQKTHNRSHSWYRTDPSTLELIFHRRMLEYPCLTDDPSSADAIFLPYYSSLDALRYLYGPDYNSSADHGLELFEFLQEDHPEIWNRRNGHDHFLVMARPAWDFTQPLNNNPPLWGTSFLELPEFFNVTALTLEARAWPWQEHAVPYPTSFHPPNLGLLESWVQRVRRSKRTSLALFAGGGGYSATPTIRRSIRLECENGTANSTGFDGYEKICEVVDCSNGICEHDPLRFMKPMLQATFCLQPPGDTPTRRSTFDGILAGCIPVFFEDLSAKSQYGWHLPENEFEGFSVFIPKEEVVFKGLRIFDVLKRIPRAKVRRMREKILELIPRIVYRKHNSSPGLRTKKDAFDITVDGTLDKIQSRLKELAVDT